MLVPQITISNLMVIKRTNKTCLWMTLNPDVASLDCMLLQRINEILNAIRTFAKAYWKVTETVANDIRV